MSAIFDAHSHYIPPEIACQTTFFKVTWSDIDRQLTSMDEHGIETALLLYPTTDAHEKMGGWENVCAIYNQKIAQIVKKYPDRFIGAGIIPFDQPDKFASELKKIEELGLSAISLASSYEGRYLDEEIFNVIYEFARNNDMPIHVHPQILNPIGEERVKDPLLTPVLEYVFDVSVCIGKMMMTGTFLKYPDVHFIFAHYGGVLPWVKERFDNTYLMLRNRGFVKDIKKVPSEYFKNLYFDTSGSKSPASLLCALEVTDENHILFGSDYPANQNLKESISTVAKSFLEENKRKKILFENNKKIFKKVIKKSLTT